MTFGIVASLAVLLLQADQIKNLESKVPKDPVAAFQFNKEVAKFIEKNTISQPADFLRVGLLINVITFDYRWYRMKYELAITAAAKGSTEAESLLPAYWDRLMISLGRPIRFDVDKFSANDKWGEFFVVQKAPDIIVAVVTNPSKHRDIARESKDNTELQAIVDADQKARENFSKMTPAELEKMVEEDPKRNRRVREILQLGELHTSNDFANASLVLQHSSRFDGFQLAHELAVCSMLLGDKKTGRWLVGASYDRMLNSIGHDQRYGTQYGPEGFKQTDTQGICDNERLALGCPKLEEARKRVFK